MIDLIMGLIDLVCLDVDRGRQYGFAFIIWRVAAGLCLLLGITFIALEWYVCSVIAFAGLIVCVICELLQLRYEIRSEREEQKKKAEAASKMENPQKTE